jgi:alpha-L-fucosidase
MDEYIDQVAVPQVKEILTNYGRASRRALVGHADNMNKERADEARCRCVKLQPGIIHNNRLGGGYARATPRRRSSTSRPPAYPDATGKPA